MSHFRGPFSLLNKLYVNNPNNHVNKSNILIVRWVSLFGVLLLLFVDHNYYVQRYVLYPLKLTIKFSKFVYLFAQ